MLKLIVTVTKNFSKIKLPHRQTRRMLSKKETQVFNSLSMEIR